MYETQGRALVDPSKITDEKEKMKKQQLQSFLCIMQTQKQDVCDD